MTEEEWRQLSLLKGKRQKGEKALLPIEFQMHVTIADALRLGHSAGWLWTHFPAGELRAEATGKRLKRMGVQAGWPDFLLIDPHGRLHCLELKRGNATLSDAQGVFQASMLRRGVAYVVARSVREAMGVLAGWRAIKVSLADQLSGGRQP